MSVNWKHWIARLDPKTCPECRDNHGKIFGIDENTDKLLPAHPFCRCVIIEMPAVEAGQGTKDGENGADWWIKIRGELPEYYITEDEIKDLGWREGKSPAKYTPDTMITRGIYQNRNKHLPDAPGRIWYEADLNYYEGRRNGHRLLWSNDGLMFVTYNHYEKFYEII